MLAVIANYGRARAAGQVASEKRRYKGNIQAYKMDNRAKVEQVAK